VLAKLLGVTDCANKGVGYNVSNVGKLVGIIPADFVQVQENARVEEGSKNLRFEKDEIEGGAVEEVEVGLFGELDSLARGI
jgi:predicted acyltransferase (DUF342 family)